MNGVFLTDASGHRENEDFSAEVSTTTYALAENIIHKPDVPIILDEEAADLIRAYEMGLIELDEDTPIKTTRRILIRTKQQKINRLQMQMSQELAKQANDPLYKKYIKFHTLAVGYRKKLEAKYAPRARSVAMRVASGGDNPLKPQHTERKAT